MRITCEILTVQMQGDYGAVEGVVAECSRCGHETRSFGTGDRSRKRCMALMNEECPDDEDNFYVDAADGD